MDFYGILFGLSFFLVVVPLYAWIGVGSSRAEVVKEYGTNAVTDAFERVNKVIVIEGTGSDTS